MATPNYDINYNDERFAKVESEKNAALTEMEKTYGGMISNSDKYYQQQIDATNKWGEEQQKLQQQQTDFAIDKIEQQKDQAKKDYTKEQSGAYVDWQKQSGEYGANAEQRASMGMANTGYSESAQVSMYNQYQNRVMTARETYNRAVLDYDNDIKEAQLKNSVILAEIANETLQKRLELSLAGFQYKNQLVLEKVAQKNTLKNTYYQRYQDVVDQINKENSLKEEVRQYNESLAENKRYHDASIANQNAQLELERDKFNWQKEQAAKASSSGGSSGGSRKKSTSGNKRIFTSKTSKGKSAIQDINSLKKSESSKSVTGNTVDMKSVLGLGYGPISTTQLAKYVAQGKVSKYVEDGKIKFKKTFNGK